MVEKQGPKGSKPSEKPKKVIGLASRGVNITAQRVKEGFGFSIMGNNNPVPKALRDRKAEK